MNIDGCAALCNVGLWSGCQTHRREDDRFSYLWSGDDNVVLQVASSDGDYVRRFWGERSDVKLGWLLGKVGETCQ